MSRKDVALGAIRNTNLRSKLGTSPHGLKTLENENSKLKEEVSILNARIEDFEVLTKSLKERLSFKANEPSCDQSLLTSKDSEIEALRKEVTFLKKNMSSKDEEIQKLEAKHADFITHTKKQTELENQILLKNEEILKLKQELLNSATKNTPQTNKLSKNQRYLTISTEADLTANAKKLYKAIVENTDEDNKWTKISGTTIKKQYKVHSSFYPTARIELKEKGLAEFKVTEDKKTRRDITYFKLLGPKEL
jgi:predicted nuclease with TOPRIM domain